MLEVVAPRVGHEYGCWPPLPCGHEVNERILDRGCRWNDNLKARVLRGQGTARLPLGRGVLECPPRPRRPLLRAQAVGLRGDGLEDGQGNARAAWQIARGHVGVGLEAKPCEELKVEPSLLPILRRALGARRAHAPPPRLLQGRNFPEVGGYREGNGSERTAMAAGTSTVVVGIVAVVLVVLLNIQVLRHAVHPSSPVHGARQDAWRRRGQNRAQEQWQRRSAPPAGSRRRVVEGLSELQLNTHAIELLTTTDAHLLFLTFGGESMADFMHNWIHHVRAIGVKAYLVAALDKPAYEVCNRAGYPSAQLDFNSSWSYFRMNDQAFLQMGILKNNLLVSFLRTGLDVLISDLDVVWLKHPGPFLTTATAPTRSALMAIADIITASDAVDVNTDTEAGGWLTRQEINTGVLLFRSSRGAIALVADWRARMQKAIDTKTWTNRNDQLFFNDAVKSTSLEALSLAAAEAALRAAGHPDPASVIKAARSEHSVRGLFRSTRPLAFEGGEETFTLSTFSITEFSNGHTHFVQRLHEAAGLTPFSVHTTHQFADTHEYPLGKRQRLREAGLWTVDGPEYYSQGNFLAVHGPLVAPADIQRVFGRFPEHDPRRHLTVDSFQRERVRDLAALAAALNRTLIMPRLFCWCDRFWNRLKRCRMPADQTLELPFHCPMDHLFFLDKWIKARMPFREHSFLSNPRVPAELASASAQLQLQPGPPPSDRAPAAHFAGRRLLVDRGACFADVLQALPSSVRVLHVDALDLGSLCPWFGTSTAGERFNQAARTALHHTVRFCTQETLEGLPTHNCPWGYRPPSALPTTAEAARRYVSERRAPELAEFTEPRACTQAAGSLRIACS